MTKHERNSTVGAILAQDFTTFPSFIRTASTTTISWPKSHYYIFLSYHFS